MLQRAQYFEWRHVAESGWWCWLRIIPAEFEGDFEAKETHARPHVFSRWLLARCTACSSTSGTPAPVSAEHSMYLEAPILDAIAFA